MSPLAKFVLVAEKILINGNDLSSFCSKAEFTISAEIKDDTTYASAGWKEELAGLKQGKLALEFYNDFTVTTGLDFIMWPLLGTVVSFEVAGTQAARGVSNPSYIGSVLISDHNPITGKVGDVDSMSVTFQTSGAVTRVTA